jgi:hypothetical protein
MVKFGVHMNFLWIIEVLAIIFLLKIHFPNYLFNFKLHWIGPQIPESTGAYLRKLPRLRCNPSWTAGSNPWFPRGYCEKCCGEGVRGDIGRQIRNPRPRSDPSLSEPVRHPSRQILHLRLGFYGGQNIADRPIVIQGPPQIRATLHPRLNPHRTTANPRFTLVRPSI